MQKLGMKPVPGVDRVTIRKSKNVSGARAGHGERVRLPSGVGTAQHQQLAAGRSRIS
jgi:hypothetical protein